MSERKLHTPGAPRDRKAAKPLQNPAPESPPSRRSPPPEAETTPSPASDEEVQRQLDEALADSFPASDPVSIVTSQHEEAWQRDRERSARSEPRTDGDGEPPDEGSRN